MTPESQYPLTEREAAVAAKSPSSHPGPAAQTIGDVARRPALGTVFLGFRLRDEIGRGAFSRVYLAQQGELADRFVVLKVTTDARRESDALARLRHPNIVPIHSVHRSGPHYAVCMPYLGTTTLVDVYRGLEGMPTLPNSGRDLFSTLNTRRVLTLRSDLLADPALPAPPQQGRPPVLASLAGRSYVEAALWLIARLADGLDHAHERGVIHRDLKPANVLLSDDGQPMILDFNLAGPARLGTEPGCGGGTPPYMSPEQLEGFAGRPRPVDGRTDIYALGIIAYELLTRRNPFPLYRKVDPEVIRVMIADRQEPPPGLREWNPSVTPAVEAIVRRCLEPDPARRYQSAGDLKIDLERHLADQPLRVAVNPSSRERLGKWCRRNRSAVTTLGLAVTALFLAIALAIGSADRGHRLTQLEAADTYRRFVADEQAAETFFLDGPMDRDRLDEGVRVCEIGLARYQVLTRSDWRNAERVTALPPNERERLADDVGRLLVLLARATARRATLDASRTDPQPGLHQALELNDAALACFAGRYEPQAVWEQRAELARLLGHADEARQTVRRAAGRPAESWSDRFLLAHQFGAQGDHRQALPLLRDLTDENPTSFAVWFARGVSHLDQGQSCEAGTCFSTAVALRPDHAGAWFHRGLAERSQRNPERARVAFDRAIALRPDHVAAYVQRAAVRQEIGDATGAAADLTRALDLGGPNPAIRARRALALRAAGDPVSAEQDWTKAMADDPTDENGWIDRGLVRASRDPSGAMNDFDMAQRLNPRSERVRQAKTTFVAQSAALRSYP